MSSKYSPLKLAALTTPYFIAVPIVIFLMNVLKVSAHDMGILTIQGIILGLFYLGVAYLSNKRKIILKYILLILVVSIPIAIMMQFVVYMAVQQYDSILIVIWVFILAIALACTYEILKIAKASKFYRTTSRDG